LADGVAVKQQRRKVTRTRHAYATASRVNDCIKRRCQNRGLPQKSEMVVDELQDCRWIDRRPEVCVKYSTNHRHDNCRRSAMARYIDNEYAVLIVRQMDDVVIVTSNMSACFVIRSKIQQLIVR